MSTASTLPSDAPKPVKFGGGLRSTNAELERRITQAIEVLSSKPSVQRSELLRIFAEDPKTRWMDKNGRPVNWRTVDANVSRARARIRERFSQNRQAHIEGLFAAYERDAANSDPRIRMMAREGMRQLMGWDAPRKTEITGADGAQLPAMIVQVVGTVIVPEPKQVQGTAPLQIEVVSHENKT